MHLQVIDERDFSAVVDDGLVEQTNRVQPPQEEQNRRLCRFWLVGWLLLLLLFIFVAVPVVLFDIDDVFLVGLFVEQLCDDCGECLIFFEFVEGQSADFEAEHVESDDSVAI